MSRAAVSSTGIGAVGGLELNQAGHLLVHADAGFLAEAALGRGQGDLLALVELLRLGAGRARASTTDWVKPVTVVKRGALTPPMPLPAEKVRVAVGQRSTRVRGRAVSPTRWWA